MKELVNKPFSQFETVVLNEGVDFNDAAVNQPEETTGDVLDEIEDVIEHVITSESLVGGSDLTAPLSFQLRP